MTGLVLLLALASAQTPAFPVTGVVADPSSRALPGARIEVTAEDGSPAASSTASRDGSFRVLLVPGRYTVTAVFPGFASAREAVDVRGPLRLELSLALPLLSEEVSVSATRNEERVDRAPQPVSIVTHEEIELRQSVNLAELLTTLPGVQLTESGPFRQRPVLRGLDSNRLLVLVDGQRLNNGRTSTSNSGIETSLVDLDQIERVEIVRGAGSVLHGSDAMAGVINIITRTPDRSAAAHPFGAFEGGYQSVSDAARLAASAGWTSPGWAVRLGATRGEYGDYRSAEEVVPNSGALESNLDTSFSLFPTGKDALRFQWTTRHGRDIGIPNATLESGFYATFPFDDRDKLAAFYSRDAQGGSRSSLQMNGYWQRQHRNFVNQVEVPGFSLLSSTETDTRSQGFDLQMSRLAGDTHRITFGAAMFSDTNEDLRAQTLFPGQPFETSLPSAPSVPDSRLTGLGLFAQDELALGERLHLNLGLRGDVFRTSAEATRGYEGVVGDPETNGTVTGSVGAVFELVPAAAVYGRVARAFRQPNLFERYFFGRGSVGGFVVPNPELRPETALDFEAGVRLRSPRARLQLDLGYFHNRIRDLITSVPGTIDGSPTLGGEPVYTNANIERAVLQGVEASLELPLSGAGQSFLVYSRNAYLHGENVTTSSPLPLVAPFTTTTGVRWYGAGARWIQDIELQGVAGSDRVPEGSGPLEGFVLLHLRGQARLFDRTGFFGETPGLPQRLTWGITNLSNADYPLLFSGIPAEGRGLRIALGWDF